MITGAGDQETVVAALKAGADAYLIKSRESADILVETLDRALQRFRADLAKQTRPLRVLHVASDPQDAEATRCHLALHAPHIRLASVADPTEALDRLPPGAGETACCDVVLLQHGLSGFQMLELVRTLREVRRLDLPVVLVAGAGSEELAAKALSLGVDDYLIKHSAYLHQLATALENAHRKVELLRERASLLEREAHIRLLLESVAEGVYGVDLDGRCTFVNSACLRMLGYDLAEELVGQPMHAAMHHHHSDGSPYPEEECRMHRASTRDEAIRCDDEVFWRRNGSPVPVEYRCYPMHRDGRVVGAVATFLDITERRRAEERLRQAAMVFEHTRDGVMLMDSDGRILAVNPAFTDITGYTEAKAIGKKLGLLQSGRHDKSFYQAIWDAARDAGHWHGEVWSRRKGGEIYPEWWSISAVRDATGRPSHYVHVGTDLSQIRRSQERLEYLTYHDPLTDLANRTLVRLRLEDALDRARRNGQRLGLLYLDLDNFKTVNDSLGHDVGDRLLLAVVERLRGRVRKEDTLGRVSGVEFVLLLEPIGESQEASAVARDLLAVLERPFSTPDGDEVCLAARIGISIYPDDAGSADELLGNAGAALDRAKKAGRGQFRFYTADMNAQALADLQLETALRRALERGELELHYQPKVDMQSGRVAGAEALLRWQRDGTEWVSPCRFIPLAEKTGLILPISDWVMDNVCRQVRAWQEAGLRQVPVSVNVSASQFRAGGLETAVAEALAHYGIPAESLELELTESVLMDDPQAAATLLARLKAIGVKIALDDFGTGYSSLAYLRHLPIDILKIDRSFVADLVTDSNAAMIVSAIIDLARRLRVKVVAEGVETETQLGYLRKQGCDFLQGYLFSAAVPGAAFAEMLRTERSLPVAAVHLEEGRTLLLVDGEPSALTALSRALEGEGYRVLTAGNAREGLDLLARHRVQVIVSSQCLAEVSGTDFLVRVRDMVPDTVRMVLSDGADLEPLIQAVNQGTVFRFLTRPWDDGLLCVHIREAFRYHEAVAQSRGQTAPGEAAHLG
jgi:diguanylate cyclase (GGDEF)-like protein/PAS domain S-box-containing protein